MHRAVSFRFSQNIKTVVRQAPIFYRFQHEKVYSSDDPISNVTKPTSEKLETSNQALYVQASDETLTKLNPQIKINPPNDSFDKKLITGEEHWRIFQKKYYNGTLGFMDLIVLLRGVYSEAQYLRFQEAPSPAYAIGCCSVLPLCSIGMFTLLTGGALPWLAYIQLTYSASLLSFLGGISWGHAMQEQKLNIEKLGWAIAPPLLAWSSTIMPLPVGFLLTAVGLSTSMIHDVLLTNYPQWFKSLRYILTVVALLSLLPTFCITAIKF